LAIRPPDKLPYPATWLNGQRWNDLPSAVSKPLAKGEVRVRETTQGEALEAGRRDEFMRLSRLNENIGKSDQDIWELVA
jgi:hypothetical protein